MPDQKKVPGLITCMLPGPEKNSFCLFLSVMEKNCLFFPPNHLVFKELQNLSG